jgi:hypothetical protein
VGRASGQGGGRDLGQSGKTGRQLPAAAAVPLTGQRGQPRHDARAILAEFTAADPFHGGNFPHLFIVAQPLPGHPDMCLDLVTGADAAVKTLNLISKITSGAGIRQLLAAAFPGIRADPHLSGLVHYCATPHGALLSSVWRASAGAASQERWTRTLEIRHDGGLRYYQSHAGNPQQTFNGARCTGLYLERILTTTREVLATATALPHPPELAWEWQLGVAVTGIRGARAAPPPSPYSMAFHNSRTYPSDAFHQLTSAPVPEIETRPARVTQRLLGQLARNLTDTTPVAFTDSP